MDSDAIKSGTSSAPSPPVAPVTTPTAPPPGDSQPKGDSGNSPPPPPADEPPSEPVVNNKGNNPLMLVAILVVVILLVAGGGLLLSQNKQTPEKMEMKAEEIEYENPFDGVEEEASDAADLDNPFATDSGYINPYEEFEEVNLGTPAAATGDDVYRNPFE